MLLQSHSSRFGSWADGECMDMLSDPILIRGRRCIYESYAKGRDVYILDKVNWPKSEVIACGDCEDLDDRCCRLCLVLTPVGSLWRLCHGTV